MSNFNYALFAVRNADGDILEDETLEKFRAGLVEHIHSRELTAHRIRETVDLVLNEASGVINSELCATLAAQKLIEHCGVSLSEFSAFKRRVQLFISANSKKEDPDSFYVSSRGRNSAGLRTRERFLADKNYEELVNRKLANKKLNSS